MTGVPPRPTGTLVIGASAAGLATAAALRRAGQQCDVLETTDGVGSSWRRAYDRLHLHTPKWSSALPGLEMPAEWPRYPSRDQVLRYLERYRVRHGLRPHYGQHVTAVSCRNGRWTATTHDGQWQAVNLVVATGANRRPVRPAWPGMGDFPGEILHSSDFRNGERWRGRKVVVVGFGNSACEQALDLVEHGATVHLSVRSAVNILPRDIFGAVPVLQLGIALRRLPTSLSDALAKPLVAVTVGDVRRLGLRKLPYGPNTQIARDRKIPLLDVGTVAMIRAGRIAVHGGIDHFGREGVTFVDGTAVDADAVILATGYRPALEEFLPQWQAVCDQNGVPVTSGRMTALPGLYFCGQFVSPAGMLREIGLESKAIARQIADRSPKPGSAPV